LGFKVELEGLILRSDRECFTKLKDRL